MPGPQTKTGLIVDNCISGLSDTNSHADFSAIVLLFVYALTPLALILVHIFSSNSVICLLPSYTAAFDEVIITLLTE